MAVECLCVKRGSGSLQCVGGIVRAKVSCAPAQVKASLVAKATISNEFIRERNFSEFLDARGQINAPHPGLNVDFSIKQEVAAVGEITRNIGVSRNMPANLIAIGSFGMGFVDKFAGDFSALGCEAGKRESSSSYNSSCSGIQKLYPIKDVDVGLSGFYFVNQSNQSGNLYSSIDEGVFQGNYHELGKISDRYSDDIATFIHPSSVYTDGVFRYKCEVDPPTVTPADSKLYFRASAPMLNYASKIAPTYSIQNIKFEDPSGNLIIQYGGISLRGDADYENPSDPTYHNYSTYGVAPVVNNLTKKQWEDGYPVMDETSGYTLTFDLVSRCLDDPFDMGFDVGYESGCALHHSASGLGVQLGDEDWSALAGSPLSTRIQNLSQNPTNSIRISAIEIANSGGFDTLRENYTNLFLEVKPTGHRIERCYTPTLMPQWDFDTGIYPLVSSVWHDNSTTYSNETSSGVIRLSQNISDSTDDTYIRMASTVSPVSDIADSGKLVLKFGHTTPEPFFTLRDGEFTLDYSSAFNFAQIKNYQPVDNFYKVDSVSLKVRAKKEVGTRDYALDVVGYSDDKLLNITSAVGGFLQNASGYGTIPQSSGFNSVDDLGISTESISDKDQYFLSSGTNNAGGDHYKLSSPVVSGTEFEWYEIPLQVYEDTVELGRSPEYKSISYFENIYLDIFPLPTGATITNIQLCLKHTPTNAINLHTTGYEKIGHITGDRTAGKIYPSSRQTGDSILNAGPDFAPISTIENIPHAYKTPTEIKTNYSRRWRGMNGLVKGPFDPDEFGFGFENPLLDSPFNSGYYDFDTHSSTTITPRVGSLTGTIVSSLSTRHYKNIGWRFQDNDIFSTHLPSHTGVYKTTDWTSLSNGSDNFPSHELYGKIADAFNSVVRLSGSNSYIDFGPKQFVSESGFSTYIRFTPDVTVSGSSYNLFESGCLFSKWDSGEDLEFALGYEGGYLCGVARSVESSGDQIIKVKDTHPYSGYQYPLPVVLTYNDRGSGLLRLYTDNEITSGDWTTHRASSVPFTLTTGTSNLMVGHSTGSGVGMSMFVTEFGVSNKGNVVYEDPDLTYKEVTAQKFLENNRVKFWNSGEPTTNDSYKLWDRIDEDTHNWYLGAFKYCEFDSSFDWFKTRQGRDLVSFRIKHDGQPYINVADNTMPANVSSGVSYHTQIENDFLRFNLSDSNDNFYAIAPRITKNLPRGYKFSERALVVETILENITTNDFEWSDGSKGPKLIVSLYTRNQDPLTYTKDNWGLINRAIHYLEPSGCINKIHSTFNYNDLFDASESWSLFPNNERRLTEFDHKYYSKDIDDMFLQYDLVYPSGSEFESRIDIHSAHVRLDDAFVSASGMEESMNIHTSGEKRPRETMNVHAVGSSGVYGTMALHAIYDPSYHSGILNLVASGGPPSSYGFLNVHTHNSQFASSGMNMTLLVGDYSGAYAKMSLYAHNTQTVNIPGEIFLPLNTHASSGAGNFAYLPMVLYNGKYEADKGTLSGLMPMSLIGVSKRESDYVDHHMNLFIVNKDSPYKSGVMNLILNNPVPANQISGSMPLVVSNHSYSHTNLLRWNGKHPGVAIEVDDNTYASIAADDEIRGVDLLCYGDCDSTGTCVEREINTHGTIWSEEQCVDGGIFRAANTYTNLTYSYSGDYYGIRKVTGLRPNSPYDVTIKGKSGNKKQIKIPSEWEEWEYGTIDDINFSGFKVVGDYPYPQHPSGRNTGDGYGRATSVKGDLLAVGAPYHTFDRGGSGYLEEAGAVFLYRRNALATSGSKGFWSFEEKLVLPSGYRDEYAESGKSVVAFPGLPPIQKRLWQVGQKGRHLGHSVDLGVVRGSGGMFDEDKEIAVVGAPGATWSGIFGGISTSGVSVGLMIVTDEFKYQQDGANSIYDKVLEQNHLWKYYADPAVHIDLKVIVVQATNGAYGNVNTNSSVPEWMIHKKVPLHILNPDNSSDMLSGIKEGFMEAFPYDGDKIHSGIPPLFGLYVDPSRTLGRKKVQPAIDNFIDFYRDYSFLSGVRTFGGVQESGHFYEYFKPQANDKSIIPEDDISEDWVSMSKTLLSNVDASGLLDTGRLVNDGGLRFITETLGEPSDQVLQSSGLQVPAPSGGRVYIFEKESGVWNLIQEIKSPSEGQFHPADRFGHAVAISKDAELIAIGSPYIEEACAAYEARPTEKQRLYSQLYKWLEDNNRTAEISAFDEYRKIYGGRVAAEMIYLELNATDKFTARKDLKIEEFKKIYRFGYGDIPYTGTWSFILTGVEDKKGVAPTSRLGYSAAVNEDGSTMVFGAPTDSLNELDDTNVYYKDSKDYYTSSWASDCNAGAVRVFSSRKHHPHSGVVEYFKFGNVDMSTHTAPSQSGNYNNIKTVFNDVGVDFRRTHFSELDIPKGAGTAFIITPEVDATSDEIMTNIKEWMSLGDRTLVLVGNDPVWEENGKYRKSNDIINKILSKLGSKMRIHAARNEYESLPACAVKPNVVPSVDPRYTRDTDISRQNMFAYGVGDIRMHMPEWETMKSPCCENWLQHNGDLRSEWIVECVKYGANGEPRVVKEWINWPFQFGNGNAGCEEPPLAGLIQKPHNDPKPLLVAGEYIIPDPIIYPAWREKIVKSECEPVYKWVTRNDVTYKFADDHIEKKEFEFVEPIHDGVTVVNNGNWQDPAPYEGRDSVLQAVGSTKDELIKREARVQDDSFLAAEQDWSGNDTSKVVIISCLDSESERNMGHDQRSTNGSLVTDGNANFYYNLVEKMDNKKYDCGLNKGTIVQLGGWTKRVSFKDAFRLSNLKLAFESEGHNVVENAATTTSEGNAAGIASGAHVCWVANPNGVPSNAEAAKIKEWLNLGNKTLVITLEKSQSIARNVAMLCHSLGTAIKPLLIHTATKDNPDGIDKWAEMMADNDGGKMRQVMHNDRYIVKGCEGKNVSHEAKFFAIEPVPTDEEARASVDQQSDRDRTGGDFVVIDLGATGKELISYGTPIKRTFFETNTFWQIKSGINHLRIPVEAGSGYRLFVNYVREVYTENKKITLYGDSVRLNPDHREDDVSQVTYDVTDYDANDKPYAYATGAVFASGIGSPAAINKEEVGHLDVRIPSGVENINLYLDANNLRISEELDYKPRTFRIVSVSGALLPIDKTTHIKHEQILLRYDCTETVTYKEHPEVVYTFPERLQPIKTDNSKYCVSTEPPAPPTISDMANVQGLSEEEMLQMMDAMPEEPVVPEKDQPINKCGGKKIADGPVIVAEEIERFSSFSAGTKRSRIILISDASIVQGACSDYRKLTNANFILSLYDRDSLNLEGNSQSIFSNDAPEPYDPSESGVFELQNLDGGRQFEHTQKLVAPERGSPHKYWAASGLPMLASRFGGGGIRQSGIFFVDSKRDPETVGRPEDPDTVEKKKKQITIQEGKQAEAGATSRFTETINSVEYVDATAVGGMPKLMQDTKKDHIDFDEYPSGYPGDLFGFSVGIQGKKIIAGAPFNGFTGQTAIEWGEVSGFSGGNVTPVSGLNLSQNGGAGAVFYFEQTGSGVGLKGSGLPWEYKQKIKPTNTNIGIDDYNDLSASQTLLGDNDYTAGDLTDMLRVGDMFGYGISIDEDFVAIGAPGHDFENYHEHIFDRVNNSVHYSGGFVRKEFNFEFDIPLHNVYDLGESGLRNKLLASGSPVLNNGAVFTYEHKMNDWENRTKEWTEAEKIVPQGYNARKQKSYTSDPSPLPVSGSENDHFGKAVYIDRANRADGDYTLAVGAPHHMFASGNISDTNPLIDAGAVYTYDAMLREQPSTSGSQESYIIAKIFGEASGTYNIPLIIDQRDGADTFYQATGMVFTNNQGELFLEASGRDPATKGFVQHRPYILSAEGKIPSGEIIFNYFNLHTDGQALSASGNMNLHMATPAVASVYNNIGLYTQSAYFVSESGLILHTSGISPTANSGGMNLAISGVQTLTEQLNLRVRGK